MSTDMEVGRQRRRTITSVCGTPCGTERAKALIQTKAKGLLNGDREPALWRRSRLFSDPLTPQLFYHCLALAGGGCDQPLSRADADISPVSESGNRELQLSMSHQSACLRTAVDVSALPQPLTLVEE